MYSLCKAERLVSKNLFEDLFASGTSFVKYPFRIVFKKSFCKGEYPARIGISVSKKKFKRAVKRNRIKCLTREAYRLNKPEFYGNLTPENTIDILFIYLDQDLPTSSKVEKAMKQALVKISALLS